ncbi:MAG TPA: SDR family NAD(P)-dependent oxidoreductase, partial [Stellaceae bacterium]
PGLLRAAARGREHHRHRLAAPSEDLGAVLRALDCFVADESAPGLINGVAADAARLAFVFSGNGAQYPGMGRAALRASADFRAAVAEVDSILRPDLGWSVTERIESGIDAAGVARADAAQPVLFAVQVGIVGALRAAGIVAEGHLGHSVGEIAAAWAAGALSLAEAARVVVARSRSQQRTTGMGRMAALALGREAAQEFLEEIGSAAEIAALNATRSVTVSGSPDEIGHLAAQARERGLWCRPLDLDFAFHSRAMEPVRDELRASLAGLSSRPPSARLASTVSGAVVESDQLDVEHWWRNIRDPVRFAEATAALIAEGFRVFVEIGPGPILHSYLTEALRAAGAEGCVLASLTRTDGDDDPFRMIAGRCYVAGCDLPKSPFFNGDFNPRGLPLYPWERQRYWLGKTVEAADFEDPPFDHPLLGFRQRGHPPNWLNHLDAKVLPWIGDHSVDGAAVFPAAAVVETALAAARWKWPQATILELTDVEIRRPIAFEPGRMREMRMALTSEEGDWELLSRPRLSSEPLNLHAVGRIAAANCGLADMRSGDTTAIDRVDVGTLYRLAARMGLHYGARFRTVERVDVFGPDRAVVHLDPVAIGEPLSEYLLHPALLDGALQGLLALLAKSGHQATEESFLPWRFARVRLAAPFARTIRYARVQLTRIGVKSASADLMLYDDADNPVAEVTGCWFQRVELHRRGAAKERLFYVDLVPVPLVEGEAPAVLTAARIRLARLARSQMRDPKWRETQSLLEAMIAAAAVRLWQTQGIPGRRFTVRELVGEGRIAPAAAAFAECLLQAVQSVGGALKADGEWQVEAETDLPDAAEIWRLLLADNPQLVGELALLGAAFDKFPDILTHGPAGPQSSLAEYLLQASPTTAAGLDFLSKTLGSIALQWPVDRPLRILEIGADGYATRRLMLGLAQFACPVNYVATSCGPELINRLEAVTSPFAGAAACQWTPGDEGAAIELIGNTRFDIVVAVHACARIKLDVASLARLRELIRPGGLFLAVEPQPNVVWDIVFGQSAEWWLNDNSDVDVSPLQTPEQWRAELATAGFRGASVASLTTGPWPAAAIWASVPARAEPATPDPVPPPCALVVIGDDYLLRGALLDRLEAAGHHACAAEASDWPAALSEMMGEEDDSSGIVFIAGGKEDAAGRQIETLAQVAHTAAERNASLWVVTRGAQQPAASDRQAGLAGGVWGFVRVLANELPRLSWHLIDIASAGDVNLHAGRIADEIAAASPETEIVWTADVRHVPRLRPGLPPVPAPRERPLTLTAGAKGGLQSLGWSASPTRAPGPGEVEIEVRAAGLNFRDVMWAMGLLPEEALVDGFAGPSFGLECAGFITAIGPDVEDMTVGDRVMAFAPAALGTRVLTIAKAVAPIPAELDFASAATLPVAFVTVVYALGHLAQLSPGEWVLIHAASGGVGLAAIQYAKHRGATVIATAGSPIKRSFLRLAGADHVLDSRDPGFADRAREITRGDGVDVVLNSLSGEAMERSLEVLKPFGRFLELGKRDFYVNRRLHMRPLRQNVSYFALDVDQLPRHRPALARSLLREVTMLLKAGAIRPLAHRSFLYSEVEDAFRLMQASGHIGKLVLIPDPDGELHAREPAEFTLRGDGTYLVTGGIDGFGFAAARWLAEHGAGALALIGRRGGQTPGCEERVAELRAMGADVQIYRADVGDRTSLATVLEEIRAALPPLRGVVHAASAIDDRLTADIEVAGIDAVVRPKLEGALALNELTRDDPIELFVLFSSATTLLGAPGQGAYVAANVALEALARHRHAEGRPALAVAWGPIEDAGYLAERPEMREALARRLGAVPIPVAQALAALPEMLASGLPVVAFAATNWGAARSFLPVLATPLFSDLRSNSDVSGSDEAVVERLRRLDPVAAQALLQSVVGEEAGRILRLSACGVDPMRPLSELGMDSLMAVELRLALESRLQLELPLMALAEGTSVASIAAR